VRKRSDVYLMFMISMCTLFIAVPSALINWAQGNRQRGFRVGASVTSGANANRLAIIYLMEVSRQVYRNKFFRPPHNSPLWALTEGGIFVVTGYAWLFWMTWRDLAVVRRLAYRDPAFTHISAALRVVLIVYLFFCAFADLFLNPITYMIGQIFTMRRYVEGLPEPAAVPVAPRIPSRLRAA
jgi:hypothetical protein